MIAQEIAPVAASGMRNDVPGALLIRTLEGALHSGTFRRLVWIVRLSFSVFLGIGRYLRTRTLPPLFWERFSFLDFLTRQRLLSSVARIVAAHHPPRQVPPLQGLLGRVEERDFARFGRTIRRDGVVVIPSGIPEPLCRSLREACLDVLPNPVVRLSCPRYDFDPQFTMGRPEVRAIATDPGILGIAERFLRSRPVCTLAVLRWNSFATKELDERLALRRESRFYHRHHFHVQGIRTLGLFIYLSDVGSENGPHCFIRGSHRWKPDSLLTTRIPDEQTLRRYYPEDRWRELTGPAGTVIAADLTGFHCGSVIRQGARLMLTLVYNLTSLSPYSHQYQRGRTPL